MTQRQRSVAEQGVRLLEDALRKNPPPGVSAERVSMFFEQHRAQLTSTLSAQLVQGLAPASGAYQVLLHALPNLDFRQGSAEIPRRWVRVRSLAEAGQRVRTFIEENSLGAGNWAGGLIRQGGRVVARVSYNGRIWQTDETGRPTGYELSPAGKILDYSGAVDETKAPCGCQHAGTARSLPSDPTSVRKAAGTRGKTP